MVLQEMLCAFTGRFACWDRPRAIDLPILLCQVWADAKAMALRLPSLRHNGLSATKTN